MVRENISGYTGGIVEEELLGSIDKKKYFEKYPDISTYTTYRAAVEYVKDTQWGDPENPSKFFPRDLLRTLRKDEALTVRVPAATYRYFTAIGSHLDRWHGVDAFIEVEYNNPTNESVIIRTTIDVTRGPHKESGYKSDLVVEVPRNGVDPSDEDYHAFVEKYATLIREHILTELNKNNKKKYK